MSNTYWDSWQHLAFSNFSKDVMSYNVAKTTNSNEQTGHFRGGGNHHKDTKILTLQVKKNDVREKEYNCPSIYTNEYEHLRWRMTHPFCP